MLSPFQRQSRIRKLTYGGLIALLFTLTLVTRHYVLKPWSQSLDLHEQELGEAELTGSVVNLTLSGSRGFALNLLWYHALQMQQRHQWSELDLTVSAITKLQPHYTGPWLWHSWNLAYNVPADCVRIEDKYFWIARGMQLLAEGQRQNRENPDLRYTIGTFYQHKFGPANDEARTLRSLLQISCLKPEERDPNQLWERGKKGEVDLKRFEEFCRRHPQLVRRLREGLGKERPRDIVQYLADHQDLPTYYPERRNEAPFPVLPSRSLMPSLEYAAEDRVLLDEFDNFAAARTWFTFAQAPLPPAPKPWRPPNDDDRARYRVPKSTAYVLFRQAPARAQTFAAERLEAEGWFDEAGWDVDAGNVERWFSHKVVIGDRRRWSRDAWTKAAEMWDEHGRQDGLFIDAAEMAELERAATTYRSAYGVKDRDLDPKLRPEDLPEEYRAGFLAHRQLYQLGKRREITNFGHFQAQASALATSKGSTVRKLLAQARKKHLAAQDAAALRLYEEAFVLWKELLDERDNLRHDLQTQEDTYKAQADYLQIIHNEEVSDAGRYHYLKALFLTEDALTQALRPPGATLWLPPAQVIHPRLLGTPVAGPFDGKARDGEPYISDRAIQRARGRFEFQDPQVAGSK